MAHIDYNAVTSLDALIDISDAAARASLVRLRELLARFDPPLHQRLVDDANHKKPVIALYRDGEAVLHVYPEPGRATGLHVSMPLCMWERRLMDTRRLADWLAEAVRRSRPRHNTVWVELTLHRPGQVDDLVDFLLQRAPPRPTLH